MILTSIKDIDAGRWDALVGAGAVARSHAYLSAIEASDIEGCQYFYPVIFNRRNEIVAHACVYLIATDFAQFLPIGFQRIVTMLRSKGWSSLLRSRITECGVPLMVGNSISVREDVARAPMVKRIADAATDIAYTQGSRVVVMRDFLLRDEADAEYLRAAGFNRVANMPLAGMTVRWDDYAGFLAAMRPRYRKDYLRRLRHAAREQTVRIYDRYSERADDWLRQLRVVFAGATRFKREMPTAAYYREIERHLGADSRLLVVERAGQPVAHGLVLVDHERTIATFFGREAGAPGKEWFLLADEVIRLSIARGSRHIQLGLGSYHAKTLVGATAEPVSIFCRSSQPLLNWLMRRAPNLANPSTPAAHSIFQE